MSFPLAEVSHTHTHTHTEASSTPEFRQTVVPVLCPGSPSESVPE